MKSRSNLQPVIIIGAARSGTKVMRDSLAAAAGAGRVPYDISYVWRYGNESLPHDCLEPADATRKTEALVRSHLGKYANSDGLVIEKTVGNSLRVGFVDAVLPDAKYVYLERDGVDVALSTRREWEAPTNWRYVAQKARHFPLRLVPSYGRKYLKSQTLDRQTNDGAVGTWGPRYPGIDKDLRDDGLLRVCARQWRWSVMTAPQVLAQLGKPVVRVGYAELIAAPEATLAHTLRELELPPDRARLTAAARMIDNKAPRSARAALTPDERLLLTDELGPTLKELGYEQP